MAKLTLNRLSNATPQYSQQQLDQIIRTLEQIVFQLNNTYTRNTEDKAAAEAWYMARY
jgi:hypothetical protein